MRPAGIELIASNVGVMVTLHFDHPRARDALVDAIGRFVETAESLSDYDLLAASRCYGWNAVDVVVHVRTGLLEMLGGVTALTTEVADQDAASYWRDYQGEDAPVEAILWTRRTSSAYTRPAGAVQHLRMAGDAVIGAVARMPRGHVAFQGHILQSGDFLATWAVELALHQLDLGHELDVAQPTAAPMGLIRETLDALLDAQKPVGWSDVTWALLGAGRRGLTQEESEHLGSVADRMPALG